MPANEHLAVYKFCRQNNITFPELQALSSGVILRTQSQKLDLQEQAALLKAIEKDRLTSKAPSEGTTETRVQTWPQCRTAQDKRWRDLVRDPRQPTSRSRRPAVTTPR